jgi:hypothetical protein
MAISLKVSEEKLRKRSENWILPSRGRKKLSGSLEAFVSIVVSNYARNRGEQSSLGKKSN